MRLPKAGRPAFGIDRKVPATKAKLVTMPWRVEAAAVGRRFVLGALRLSDRLVDHGRPGGWLT